jgi:hypothetical protein
MEKTPFRGLMEHVPEAIKMWSGWICLDSKKLLVLVHLRPSRHIRGRYQDWRCC